jgi:hypothetical protein
LAPVSGADIPFHLTVDKKYRLVALGGGHLSMDHIKGRLLKAALPSYKTAIA